MKKVVIITQELSSMVHVTDLSAPFEGVYQKPGVCISVVYESK